MATITGPQSLAPSGSSAIQAYTALNIGADVDAQAIQFTTENAGTTVTWKIQGSYDGTVWYDVPYVTDTAGAAANTAITQTTTGSKIIFIDLPTTRDWPKLRLNVTANTGYTFRCELWTSNALS